MNHRIFALALSTLLATIAVAPTAVAAENNQVTPDEKVAVVRVEIREADGTVVRARPQAVKWGATAAFQLPSSHALQVTTGTELAIDYRHDGNAIEAVPAASRGSQRVFRTQGDVEIVVRVTTTNVHVDAQRG